MTIGKVLAGLDMMGINIYEAEMIIRPKLGEKVRGKVKEVELVKYWEHELIGFNINWSPEELKVIAILGDKNEEILNNNK